MQDVARLETWQRVERQLVDIVTRHHLDPVNLTPDDFADGLAHRAWTAITAIWNDHEEPTVQRVVDRIAADGGLTPHERKQAAIDIMFLPTGQLDHLDDYIVHVADHARRRRVALALAEAATAVDRGADPDAVLARVRTVA